MWDNTMKEKEKRKKMKDQVKKVWDHWSSGAIVLSLIRGGKHRYTKEIWKFPTMRTIIIWAALCDDKRSARCVTSSSSADREISMQSNFHLLLYGNFFFAPSPFLRSIAAAQRNGSRKMAPAGWCGKSRVVLGPYASSSIEGNCNGFHIIWVGIPKLLPSASPDTNAFPQLREHSGQTVNSPGPMKKWWCGLVRHPTRQPTSFTQTTQSNNKKKS